MKVHVNGESSAARKLREYLETVGYQVTRFGAAYAIRMEDGAADHVLVEGPESELSAEAQRAIAELATVPVRFRKAPKGSDREVTVFVDGAQADAAERGILRALLRVTEHGAPKASRAGWLKKIFS